MANQVDANDRRVRYVWTTGAQVFDYDFPLSDAANIAVYLNNDTTAEDSANFVVDLVAKTVTYTPTLTADDVVVLEGLETLTRTDGYPLRGGLSSSLLNGDVNNIYYALQEMRRDISHALVLVKSAPDSVNPTIPAPVANAVIVGNSDGSGFAVGPLTTDIAAVALHLTNIDNVSADLTNINSVAADLANIDAVEADLANISAVASDLTAINAVLSGAAYIVGVYNDLANIDACAADLTSISAAPAAATSAATSSTSAAASAVAAQAAANSLANEWSFATSTTMADPTTGKFRLDNATLASVVNIALSASSNDAGNPSLHGYILTWDDSNHSPRGIIRLVKDDTHFAIYGVNGAISDNTIWLEVPVTFITSVGSFSASDAVYVNFIPYGNDGTGTGNVSNTGTPTNGQFAQFTNATTVQGITATAATAALNALVGDSGSGGTKGLAPAPGAGDAAATKFLMADATYKNPAITAILTGYASASGTVASTDTILGAVQKLNGNQVSGITPNNAMTVTSNAGTCPVTNELSTFTNSSAATMAITLATASAVDGQKKIVRIYDFSAVAQTIGWTNTENSQVSAPTTSNGSTTLPLTVGFIYNGQTSKWRCMAVA